MTYTKQTTLWCDATDCEEWSRYDTNKVSRARKRAKRHGWQCSSDKDLCVRCADLGEDRP